LRKVTCGSVKKQLCLQKDIQQVWLAIAFPLSRDKSKKWSREIRGPKSPSAF